MFLALTAARRSRSIGALHCARAFATTTASIGGSFSLNADQAKQSFDLWALGFVPSSEIEVKSIRPVLLPFYSQPVSDTSHELKCMYAGKLFSDNLVSGMKIDPHHWNTTTRVRLDDEKNKALMFDSVRDALQQQTNTTLLPGFLVEFKASGFPFNQQAFVGAQTGRTSGLKLFTWRDGLLEAFRFYFSRDSIIPAFFKFILMIWWPVLFQVVLLSSVSWSVFRALLSPHVARLVDKAVMVSPPQWSSQALHTIIAGQFTVYDPENDIFQLKAKQRAQQFIHDFIHQATSQQQSARETEDFFRDLFRFQSTQAKQEEFFRRMQEEHARQQQEFSQQYQRGQTEDDMFNQRFRRRRQVNQDDQQYSDFFNPRASSAKQVDLYALLGVKPDATLQEIQKGYRQQLLKFHPDHYKGDQKVAEQKTHEIIEAYRTLKDTAKRREYDNMTRRR